MNAIVNHKTISFCWPFGPRDSGPEGKPIIPHLRRYQGFAVVHYSVTLDALYLGYPSKGGSPTSTFAQSGFQSTLKRYLCSLRRPYPFGITLNAKLNQVR